MNLVREATDNIKVITIGCVRLFGRRIRRYMLAYLGIEQSRAAEKTTSTLLLHTTVQLTSEPHLKVPAMSLQLVERLVKVHKSPSKSHRNILDSEMKYLRQVVRWMKKQSSCGCEEVEEETAAEGEIDE